MSEINIKNKKASFEYHFLSKYVAGIVLTGTEIKSIRKGEASIKEAYCTFISDELWILNMHISELKEGSYNNHTPRRQRKLLLNKQELNKLSKNIKTKGNTIVPLKLFISKSGYAKIEIALSTGKKLHDKREDLKSKDAKREMDRKLKSFS
ncbi:MAG: SsrA-binding protein SmpB [Flavobacteriales bacterium]|nr:SsrA-binding protein SmpB [Flavobacteriales bacterium]